MKLLLTSGGVSNPSIRAELVALLGRPPDLCTALVIPTAEYGHPACTPYSAWRFVSGDSPAPMADLGWARVGLLELTALPSLEPQRWQAWVREADVLLVDGGDALFLAHWMRASGLADLIDDLPDHVWVGVSAGSMVMTPRVGPEFTQWQPPEGAAETLGAVDFAIFPHLDYPGFDENTLPDARHWAARIGVPSYALDDQSAVVVDAAGVRVVSEGQWHAFAADGAAVGGSAGDRPPR
ncbi:Type 1 glutamine amidotransferase-like domain-containing protein [Micrococcales bacterium 31B]|nr:Type 1 glutamine amidotransferase-like domain-containing protein [Micrococcales bacterium 31B]